jgi:hypothetical protein
MIGVHELGKKQWEWDRVIIILFLLLINTLEILETKENTLPKIDLPVPLQILFQAGYLLLLLGTTCIANSGQPKLKY